MAPQLQSHIYETGFLFKNVTKVCLRKVIQSQSSEEELSLITKSFGGKKEINVIKNCFQLKFTC